MGKTLHLKQSGKYQKGRKAERQPVIQKKRTIMTATVSQAQAQKDTEKQAEQSAKDAMLQAAQSLVPFKVLAPFASCLVTIDQLQAAIDASYPEIYIQHQGQLYQHMQLRGGRHVRIKVDHLPKKYKEVEDTITTVNVGEELNFLPAGKIPGEYWDQVVEFFRQVMKTKKSDMEAHAWILWSQARGYYISIPKQVVSKASVAYSYDAEALPGDSIIVVDIHSHNTMGAFYSGTDNNDDKDKIFYTGVVGKLSDKSYEYVLRFNLRDQKINVKVEDVFHMVKEVAIPAEWLDQVEVRTYTQGPGRGRLQQYIGTGNPGSTPNNPAKWSYPDSLGQRGAGHRPGENTEPDVPTLWDMGGGSFGYFGDTEPENDPVGNTSKNVGKGGESESNLGSPGYRKEMEALLQDIPGGLQDDLERLDKQAVEFLKRHGYDEEGNDILTSSTEQGDGTQMGKGFFTDDDYTDESNLQTALAMEILGTNGKEAAVAYEIMDSMIVGLEGCDKALIDIASQCYHLMSTEGRAKLETNGLN